jgi:hypothetical protein
MIKRNRSSLGTSERHGEHEDVGIPRLSIEYKHILA